MLGNAPSTARCAGGPPPPLTRGRTLPRYSPLGRIGLNRPGPPAFDPPVQSRHFGAGWAFRVSWRTTSRTIPIRWEDGKSNAASSDAQARRQRKRPHPRAGSGLFSTEPVMGEAHDVGRGFWPRRPGGPLAASLRLGLSGRAGRRTASAGAGGDHGAAAAPDRHGRNVRRNKGNRGSPSRRRSGNPVRPDGPAATCRCGR